ncbi:MAG: phosphate transport system regulatory protein PhoU, partial [Planctomycetota bacterium]
MTAHFVHLLEALRRRSLRMAGLVEDVVQEACESVFQADPALARRVIARDAEVDTEEVDVESEVIRLMALYQPVGSDLRLLCTILKVNNDLERIADCAVNIAERARHLDHTAVKVHLSRVREMDPIVRRMLRQAVQAYGTQETEIARPVFSAEEAVDAPYGEVISGIVAEAARAPTNMPAVLDVLSVAKN